MNRSPSQSSISGKARSDFDRDEDPDVEYSKDLDFVRSEPRRYEPEQPISNILFVPRIIDPSELVISVEDVAAVENMYKRYQKWYELIYNTFPDVEENPEDYDDFIEYLKLKAVIIGYSILEKEEENENKSDVEKKYTIYKKRIPQHIKTAFIKDVYERLEHDEDLQGIDEYQSYIRQIKKNNNYKNTIGEVNIGFVPPELLQNNELLEPFDLEDEEEYDDDDDDDDDEASRGSRGGSTRRRLRRHHRVRTIKKSHKKRPTARRRRRHRRSSKARSTRRR
jgi:hypothetical protein